MEDIPMMWVSGILFNAAVHFMFPDCSCMNYLPADGSGVD